VAKRYPNKQIVITETGWPTNSTGGEISSEFANQMNQMLFINEIDEWSKQEEVTVFFFEAFDEVWKGSNNPYEPEKHWGIYFDSRRPKIVKNK